MPKLAGFSLVGGTALSLKYGHRKSIDLDLFCEEAFDREIILKTLEESFGKNFVYDGKQNNWAIFGFIHDIKVDFVHYQHSLIENKEIVEGIRMYSTEDIIAMKINAILGRGKKKDFWDLFELLHHFSLDQVINYHSRKFPTQQLIISIPKALVYFEDAEESEEPFSLKGQTWNGVKKYIQQKVNDFLR